MAANTHSVVCAATGGQSSSSFADIINFSSPRDAITIDNHSTTVGLYMTYATHGATATAPTNGGDDCYFIPAGAFRVFPFPQVSQVKLIGDANTSSYTVASI
jgi:hypothetical protein